MKNNKNIIEDEHCGADDKDCCCSHCAEEPAEEACPHCAEEAGAEFCPHCAGKTAKEDSCPHCAEGGLIGADSCCGGSHKKIGKLSEKNVSTIILIVSAVAVLVSFVLQEVDIKLVVDVAWIAIVLSGVPILISAVKNLFKGKITSALLVSVALVASCCIGEFFAAGEVALIMTLGEFLENMTLDRANKSLTDLVSLAPDKARRLTEDGEETVASKLVQPGDRVRVLKGERVPLDGKIVSGGAAFDQSAITGESLPVEKQSGESVFQGTIVTDGNVDIEVTKSDGDSAINTMARLVREASSKKARVVKIADRIASFLVPAAIAAAIIVGVVTRDITRAVTVMVVFCPCSLVLATPTAIMASIALAGKNGIIVRSGEAMENLSKVTTVAFDKTGTLTAGKLELTDAAGEYSREGILALAGSLEKYSTHPVARAVLKVCEDEYVELAEASEVEETGGKGIRGTVNGIGVAVGNEKYVTAFGADVSGYVERDAALGAQGKTVLFVAADNKIVGLIALADVIRPESKDAVQGLHALGIECVLLTGDSKNVAREISRQAGVDAVVAETLPGEKMDFIAAKCASGQRVAMVGDGINDAPALKSATVGIAMGATGTDIAVESADVVLMKDDLNSLKTLFRYSKTTYKTILINICFSMSLNVVAIVLASLGIIDPVVGALVHNAGSVLVVGNSALLMLPKRFK